MRALRVRGNTTARSRQVPAKMARGGDAWWMVAYPQAYLRVDVIACTDAGVCVQEGCATRGGYLLARGTQECIAMWRERRTLADGELVDVNAEEARAVETALGLLRLVLGRRWEAWMRARLWIVTVLTVEEYSWMSSPLYEASFPLKVVPKMSRVDDDPT